MSLKLSKNNTPAYDYLSEDGVSNPVTRSVVIDKSGGSVVSSPLTMYLVASKAGNDQIGGYSGISVAPEDADASPDGATWQVSLDGSAWSSSVTPADADCSSADVVIPVYTRVSVDNSESTVAATGNYAARFRITATENPPV